MCCDGWMDMWCVQVLVVLLKYKDRTYTNVISLPLPPFLSLPLHTIAQSMMKDDLTQVQFHTLQKEDAARHANRLRLKSKEPPFEWCHLNLPKNDVSHALLRDIGIEFVERRDSYIRLWMEMVLRSKVLQLDHHEKYYARMTVNDAR